MDVSARSPGTGTVIGFEPQGCLLFPTSLVRPLDCHAHSQMDMDWTKTEKRAELAWAGHLRFLESYLCIRGQFLCCSFHIAFWLTLALIGCFVSNNYFSEFPNCPYVLNYNWGHSEQWAFTFKINFSFCFSNKEPLKQLNESWKMTSLEKFGADVQKPRWPFFWKALALTGCLVFFS